MLPGRPCGLSGLSIVSEQWVGIMVWHTSLLSSVMASVGWTSGVLLVR